MDQVFLGNDQMTVDEKGRVGIPRRFMTVLRAADPDHGDGVGVMITPERSIKVMPVAYFNQELARWSGLNEQIDEERMILNLSTSMAELAALDKQNRIKLNPLMMELCSIDRQVVVVGSIKFMQIFDVKVWRQMFERDLPRLSDASTAVATRAATRPAAAGEDRSGRSSSPERKKQAR
jgi:MraZ protein